jgi:uncharacterized protein with HEPN domain
MPHEARKRDAAAIRDMLSAMNQADLHVVGLTEEIAGTSPQPRDAALYRILVLGEAANRVSPETQAKYPEVPWADVIGMRNIIIHGYEKVDWGTVWNAIQVEFPVLTPILKQILSEME